MVVRSLARRSLTPVVEQLVRDVVADEFEGEQRVADVASRLLSKIGNMPPHLGFGMAALTLAFEAQGPVWHRLDDATRRARFEAWRGRPVVGDWVQFWEKMGVFVYWSVVEEEEDHAHG